MTKILSGSNFDRATTTTSSGMRVIFNLCPTLLFTLAIFVLSWLNLDDRRISLWIAPLPARPRCSIRNDTAWRQQQLCSRCDIKSVLLDNYGCANLFSDHGGIKIFSSFCLCSVERTTISPLVFVLYNVYFYLVILLPSFLVNIVKIKVSCLLVAIDRASLM